MKKFSALALSFVFSVVVVAAALSVKAEAGSGNSGPITIGSVVEDFKLPDAAGKEHSLGSLKGGKGTALIFVSTGCPVSNAYNERMEKLAQDFKARGIHVVGINSNVAETPEMIMAHAAQSKLTFPILKDKGNRLADRLGAQRTPEVYLLDASNKLVYQGRIDNAQNPQMVATSELRSAMEEILSGKPVSQTQAKAFGCSIKRG